MAENARIGTTVHAGPTTRWTPELIDPVKFGYFDARGQFGAGLVSGDFTLKFNYGWSTPGEIRAGIANLRTALDALEAAVDAAAAPYLDGIGSGAIAGLTPDMGDHFVREAAEA